MSEDIHNLLGRYFSGQATEQESAAVLEWINSSEENASEFGLLEKIWQGFEDQPSINFDTARAWTRVDSQLATPRRGRVISIYKIVIGVAALLVVVLGALWLNNSMHTGMQTAAALNGTMELTLQDGSRVSLRQGASLQYPDRFKGGPRQVVLEGEAFFEVSKDPARPFVIKAAGAELKVLGTSFLVNAAEDRVALVVRTGRVSFAPAGDSSRRIVVAAGEKAMLSAGMVVSEQNADPNFDAWRTKNIVFSNTPIEEAASVLGDYFGVRIAIGSGDTAQIAGSTITHQFNDPSLESALRDLELITSYQVRKVDDGHYEISIK